MQTTLCDEAGPEAGLVQLFEMIRDPHDSIRLSLSKKNQRSWNSAR